MTDPAEVFPAGAALPPLRERTIQRVLLDAAASVPEKTALRDDGGAQLSYRELVETACRFAQGFRDGGVERDDRVLIMLDNHADAVLAWLGLVLGGAVEVPVNTAYKRSTLAHVVRDSAARAIVIEESYCERLAEIADDVPALETVVVRGGAGAALPPGRFRVRRFDELAQASAITPRDAEPWEVFAVLYTSGTTGQSKGVVVTHAHAYGYATPAFLGAASNDDVVLVSMPLFHAGGQLWGVLNGLIARASVVVVGGFHATSFWEEVRAFGATYTTLVGAMASFLAAQPAKPDDRDHPLRRVCVAPVVARIDEFAARFGVEVGTGFGMTEASSPIIAPFGHARPNGCGWARPDFEVRLVDAHDSEVARGATGELTVRGTEPWTTMAGYLGLPGATAEAWRNLWLHTGDLMYQDATGHYVFVDRVKDSIRRRGENVSSAELEAVVNRCPGVARSAAVAVASEHSEDEIKVAYACVPEAPVTEQSLFDFLVAELPSFMVPRYLERYDELPLTPTQKLAKATLREHGVRSGTWDHEAQSLRSGA